jgi:hypothetical protein
MLLLVVVAVLVSAYSYAQFPDLTTDPNDPKWYYIQFKKSGWVIQQNGADQPVTAVERIEGNEAQIWKFEEISGNIVLISNKANPALRLCYWGSNSTPTHSPSGYYGRTAADQYASYRTVLVGIEYFTTSGLTFPDHPDWITSPMIALSGYQSSTYPLANPSSLGDNIMRLGSGVVNMEPACLNFIPYTSSTGIKEVKASATLHVYPTITSESVTVIAPEGVAKVVVINSLGQIVETTAADQPIDVSAYAKGIYFVKANSTSATGKFIVK